MNVLGPEPLENSLIENSLWAYRMPLHWETEYSSDSCNPGALPTAVPLKAKKYLKKIYLTPFKKFSFTLKVRLSTKATTPVFFFNSNILQPTFLDKL